MSEARRAVPSLSFNGTNVTTKLEKYLEKLSYTDIASGTSDSLSIELQNIEMKWLADWFPTKGSKISGSISFKNWDKEFVNLSLNLGTFVLDEVKFSGGPLMLTMGAVAIPANQSFKSRERTKTWKKVTIKKIAQGIAKRYKLSLSYSAPNVSISSIEQSKKSDSAFLSELCDKYGIAMKVFNKKLVIYDHKAAEKGKVVANISRKSFIDDKWDFVDSLNGVYTGARISYKNPKKSSSINETCSSRKDAYYKAAAKVNESNREATVITGTMWANPKICAGVCVNVTGMGKANGKYYVDEVTTEISSSGTTQDVSMHKCQPQLTYSAKKKKKKKKKKTTTRR